MKEEKIIDIVVPNQGLTVEEVVVVEWHKKEGEVVKKGELILDFETDKSILEFESPEDGVLTEIIAAEGETIPIGGLLARITID